MTDCIVTDSNGTRVLHGSAPAGLDTFSGEAEAKAFALRMANEHKQNYRVYEITLLGTYVFPSNTAVWE